MRTGRLITVEGLDGAGKTTLTTGLADELARAGVSPVVLREPGGVALAEKIRELVKDPAAQVDPRAEALLYAAARAQLVAERVRPALESGSWVLLDRFVDSSLTYQGVGRRLGVEQVAAINSFATGDLRPDKTLLLRIDPAIRARRLSERGEPADRLEAAGDEFFARIGEAYDRLAAAERGRWVVLDAAEPPGTVLEEAMKALSALLRAT